MPRSMASERMTACRNEMVSIKSNHSCQPTSGAVHWDKEPQHHDLVPLATPQWLDGSPQRLVDTANKTADQTSSLWAECWWIRISRNRDAWRLLDVLSRSGTAAEPFAQLFHSASRPRSTSCRRLWCPSWKTSRPRRRAQSEPSSANQLDTGKALR